MRTNIILLPSLSRHIMPGQASTICPEGHFHVIHSDHAETVGRVCGCATEDEQNVLADRTVPELHWESIEPS